MNQDNIIVPAEILLNGYAQGIFPMSPRKNSVKTDELEWYLPHYRGIIPMEQFKISKNTARNLRKTPHSVHYNRDFRGTMLACAKRRSTWISPVIIESYLNLHQLEFAHSVEIYDENDALIGGLYGVSLGTAFFGESMFHFKPDADKFALFYCHQRLKERGFTLWDTQFYTDHLGTFGAIEIPNETYQQLLQKALIHRAIFAP